MLVYQLGDIIGLCLAIIVAFIIGLLFLVDLIITVLENITNKHNRRRQKRHNKED